MRILLTLNRIGGQRGFRCPPQHKLIRAIPTPLAIGMLDQCAVDLPGSLLHLYPPTQVAVLKNRHVQATLRVGPAFASTPGQPQPRRPRHAEFVTCDYTIETCFENGKQELGLGDYQMRSWTGWHHHMTLCILAHFFLVRLKSRLQDKAPDLTLPQTMLLLKSVLPQPTLDTENALEIVNYYQRRHEAAHQSHRKRRLKRRD